MTDERDFWLDQAAEFRAICGSRSCDECVFDAQPVRGLGTCAFQFFRDKFGNPEREEYEKGSVVYSFRAAIELAEQKNTCDEKELRKTTAERVATPALDAETIGMLKKSMGFLYAVARCETCAEFRGAEFTEDGIEMPDRCAASLFWMPVNRTGGCRHHRYYGSLRDSEKDDGTIAKPAQIGHSDSSPADVDGSLRPYVCFTCALVSNADGYTCKDDAFKEGTRSNPFGFRTECSRRVSGVKGEIKDRTSK